MYARSIPAPAVRPTLPRRWLLTVGMLVALLQSSVFAIVDPDLSGWHPLHGHVSLGAHAEDHTHPWDHDHRESTEFGDPVEVGFTGSGDIGSVAGMALPGVLLLALVLGAAVIDARMHRGRSPHAHAPEVLVPPPRS
jgi:hypothetical protein